MGCIFFEGFNHKNSDHTNLDISYWSGDYSYNFIDGRTDTCHIIPSRSSEDSDLNNNKTLWLSGFPAITGDNTYYGFGAFIGQITTNTSGNGSSFPYRENIVSFYDDSTEIFRLNTTWMTQSGIAIELEQNGSYTEIPLFYNPLPSDAPFSNNIVTNNPNHSIDNRTYTISSIDDRTHLRLLTPRNRIDLTSVVDDICNNENQEIVTASAIYLEVFGQSNDGTTPATTGTLHVKVDGVEITPATGISVSGFNNLNKIAFHGTHHASGECSGYYDGISLQPEYRIVDDMYLASGTGIAETNLGASTRIFRITPNSNTRNEWKRNFNTTANINDILSSNDNQQWVGTNVEGALCINHYDNLNTTNTIIDGIKVNNLDQSDYDQRSYCNVIVSGSNANSGPFLTLGSPKSTDTRYFKDNNEFVFQNPVTKSLWTKTDIDQIQMGVVAGTVTSDCESNGGIVIQGAGVEFANGIYCLDISQGQSLQNISIQSNHYTYYNTKNNGYYISYQDFGDQGWYLYNNFDQKIYKNNADVNSSTPYSSWSVSDQGIFPAPNTTIFLNTNPYSYSIPQSINYTP